jgi:hypothetical protein
LTRIATSREKRLNETIITITVRATIPWKEPYVVTSSDQSSAGNLSFFRDSYSERLSIAYRRNLTTRPTPSSGTGETPLACLCSLESARHADPPSRRDAKESVGRHHLAGRGREVKAEGVRSQNPESRSQEVSRRAANFHRPLACIRGKKSFAAKRTGLSKLGLLAASLTNRSNDQRFKELIEPLVH